jgi:hypothetical protein
MMRVAAFLVLVLSCAAGEGRAQASHSQPAETGLHREPKLAQMEDGTGSWAKGFGLHAYSTFGSGKHLTVPALSGEDIISSIAREMEDDRPNSPHQSRAHHISEARSRGEFREAKSVADVVGDEFQVPLERVRTNTAVRESSSTRALSFRVAQNGILREGDVADWGGDLGEEGVRSAAKPKPKPKPPPPPPREVKCLCSCVCFLMDSLGHVEDVIFLLACTRHDVHRRCTCFFTLSCCAGF